MFDGVREGFGLGAVEEDVGFVVGCGFDDGLVGLARFGTAHVVEGESALELFLFLK